MSSANSPAGMGLELVQAAFHLRVDLRAGAPEQGRVHVAEAHVTGQVVDLAITLLGGGDEAVEHGEPLVGHQRRRVVAPAQPPAQDRHGDRRGALEPGHRPEEARQGLLQLRGAVQRRHAVTGQRAPELVEEGRGQPAGVEAGQVGEQVIFRAAGVFIFGSVRLAPRQRGDVSEYPKQLPVLAQQAGVGGARNRLPPPAQLASGVIADVIAEQVTAQGRETAVTRADRIGCGGQAQPWPGRVMRTRLIGRLQLHQRRAGLHVGVDRGEQRADRAGKRSRDRRLHLHALDHHQRVPGPDGVARGDLDGRDERRRRSADQAAAVPGDDVGHAVDLDGQRWSLGAHDDAMTPPEARHDPLVAPEVLNVHFDHAVAGFDPVVAAAQAAHAHPVQVAAQAEFHLVPGIGGELRSAAGRGREEGRLDRGLVGVGRLDGCLQHRHGMLRREVLRRRGQPVKPPAIVAARVHLGPVEQGKQPRLAGRSAVDDGDRLGQAPVQPAQCLTPVLSPSRHRGDHRAGPVGDVLALPDADADADPGARWQSQRDHAAWRHGEGVFWILRRQAGLDGVPAGRRRAAGQPAAAGDVQLQLGQVEPGGQLGDQQPARWLDLEVSKPEVPCGRIDPDPDPELHGAGAAVAHGRAQPDGRVAQRLLAGRVERRAGRLHDDRLIQPPDADVADADRPDRAVAIGHHLDGHVAHRRSGRCAGPVTGIPRRHRNTDALGQLPGPRLVAQQADDATARTDEGDALALAQPGQFRWVRDEFPARPHRIGTRLRQRCQQPGRVKADALVTAGVSECRRAEQHGLVGLPHGPRCHLRQAQGDRGHGPAGFPVELRDRG